MLLLLLVGGRVDSTARVERTAVGCVIVGGLDGLVAAGDGLLLTVSACGTADWEFSLSSDGLATCCCCM